MSVNAALLAVLGVVGYVLLKHCCHRTSFRWDALEWQQNLFESTALGLGLYAACRLLSPLLSVVSEATDLPFAPVLAYFDRQLPLPFAGSVVSALALGGLLSTIANLVWPRDIALGLAVRNHGGSLRSLLHDAHLDQRPVMLTLSSRKVYVGWVYIPPVLRESAHVVLFPTLSGARNQNDLEIRWSTDYSPAYRDLMARMNEGELLTTTPKHFQLVIPLDSITSATYFDRELYDRHFASVGSGKSDR